MDKISRRRSDFLHTNQASLVVILSSDMARTRLPIHSLVRARIVDDKSKSVRKPAVPLFLLAMGTLRTSQIALQS